MLGLVAMNNSIEMFLAAMISDAVFERDEGLRCLCLESALPRRSSANGAAYETPVYRTPSTSDIYMSHMAVVCEEGRAPNPV
jgi:hypothetical protein